jgi:hypothetical protein
LNRLTQSLADVCRQHLLTEKWLVAPSLRVGHQWLETMARGGQPAVNVLIKTVKSLAIDLAAPEMASRGMTLAPNRAGTLLIDRVVRNLHGGQLQYLGGVDPSAGVAATLLGTIEAVRISGLDVTNLALDEFEVATKGEDLCLIARKYLQLLAEEKLIDYAEVLRLAADRLSAQPDCLGAKTMVSVV